MHSMTKSTFVVKRNPDTNKEFVAKIEDELVKNHYLIFNQTDIKNLQIISKDVFFQIEYSFCSSPVKSCE